MKNTMNIFAETLAIGGTIFAKNKARITGDKVGAENYAIWRKTMEQAHKDFYEYKRAIDDTLRGRTVDLKTAENTAFKSLQAIIDLVGEINGFKLEKSVELLAEVSKYAVAEKTMLVGEAFTLKSQLDNCNLELKKAGYSDATGTYNNGINPDYIKGLVDRRDELKEKLDLAKKSADSGRPYDSIASYTSFCTNFERKLAKLSQEQSMKSYEEIEAEKKAKNEQRKLEKKARKAAK